MKQFWIGLVLGTVVCAATWVALRGASSATPEDPVARGSYLVNSLGCADCHAPKRMGAHGPEPDSARFLSGSPEDSKLPAPPSLPPGPWVATTSWDMTAWAGPWGISYASNLTPDEGTGIGMWTEEMFIGAIRNGKKMGVGRGLLPPMPWPVYRNFSDADLKAMFAYLKSLPAVSNRVPDPLPPAAPAAVAAASAK